MEIKGIISEGESKSITCCTSIIDIKVGDKSLYDELERLFSLDAEKFWDNSDEQSPMYALKYVVLNKAPKKETDFATQSGEVVTASIIGQHQSGCYSEYTCSYGGFDYVNNEGGHSIFEELKQHIGKYLHLKI